MQSILQWGADLIVALQQYKTPWLDTFFETFTWFGGHGYLYMVPLLVWALGPRRGWQFLTLFLLTAFLNGLLKDWIELPRPFEVDPRIVSDGEQGYSLPSGHAQLVVAFWGLLAVWLQRTWAWVVAILIIATMGISRVYLGVHYPSDILAGWLLGALGLWAWVMWAPRVVQWLQPDSLARCLGLLVGGLVGLCLLGLLLGGESFTYGAIGMLAGAGLGMVLGRGLAGADTAAWWQRGLRAVLGMAGLLLMLGSMQSLAGTIAWRAALEALVLTLPVGLWLTLFPWVAKLLRLSRTGQ